MDEVISWIDVDTLLLLFCMMVLVAIIAGTGIFDWLAVYAYKVNRIMRLFRLKICFSLAKAMILFTCLFLDNRWQVVALNHGSVFVHHVFILVTGQRDDRAANDSSDHPIVRGDAAEPGPNLNRYGGLFQHRRRHDADRWSTKCHYCFQSRYSKCGECNSMETRCRWNVTFSVVLRAFVTCCRRWILAHFRCTWASE